MTARRPAALEQLRVLDLAGPSAWYCTRLLADLGADVVRVEPLGGDSNRLQPHVLAGGSSSLPYSWFNAGKRSVVLDLETDAGVDEFRNLAAGADAVIETFAPGWLDQRGIGFETLATFNPRLVMTSVTPFGQTGPRSAWRGTDLTSAAVGGLVHLAGCPSSPPSQPGGEQAYLLGGVVAAAFTLISLRSSAQRSRGEHLDISLQDAIVFTTENAVGFADLMGIDRARMGTRFYGGEPMFRRTVDGWIIGRVTGRWTNLLAWLEETGLDVDTLRDEDWNDHDYRSRHIGEIYDLVESLSAQRTKHEVAESAQQHRIVVSPVATVSDLANDPQLAARDFWVDLEHSRQFGEPEMVRFPGAPFKLSQTPWRIPFGVAEPGEHNGAGWRTSRFVPEARTSGPDLPLAGLRVLDLTWVIAGPAATQVLADFGAEVLKVESSVHPDSLRLQALPRPPWSEGINRSGLFNLINGSKRSIALDLSTERGRSLFRRLLKLADVVVDNYGVDPFPKWGLTPEVIRALNPDLIVARSSVMGRTGPRSNYIGVGYTIGAAAGLNALSGFPGDPPVGTCTAHPDYSCNPFHLVVAILAALHHRDRTGVGQEVDLAQHESTVVFSGPAIVEYGGSGRVAGPSSNRSACMAPHGIYRCRGDNRWVAFACETNEDWQLLCHAIDRPGLALDPRFLTLAGRKQFEDILDKELTSWTRLWHPSEAMERLQAAGVPAGAVQTATEILQDPHLAARHRFNRVRHPELGWTTVCAAIAHVQSDSAIAQRASPLLGQDTEAVLRNLLGFDEDGLAQAYLDEALQ